jgi:hypothetical protein
MKFINPFNLGILLDSLLLEMRYRLEQRLKPPMKVTLPGPFWT